MTGRYWSNKREHVMWKAQRNRSVENNFRSNHQAKAAAIHAAPHSINGASLLFSVCTALTLLTFVPAASAQCVSESTRLAALPPQRAVLDLAALPPLASIDARTDITVFLQNGVPDGLRLAALRRAWITDPAIRDFKGLVENDWDFDGPNSVPGFGPLSPELDVNQMVARIIGTSRRVLTSTRSTSGAASN
jgi:hypothetical protein